MIQYFLNARGYCQPHCLAVSIRKWALYLWLYAVPLYPLPGLQRQMQLLRTWIQLTAMDRCSALLAWAVLTEHRTAPGGDMPGQLWKQIDSLWCCPCALHPGRGGWERRVEAHSGVCFCIQAGSFTPDFVKTKKWIVNHCGLWLYPLLSGPYFSVCKKPQLLLV